MTRLLSFCCNGGGEERRGEEGADWPYLDQGTYYAEGREAKILKGPSFGCGVEEGV